MSLATAAKLGHRINEHAIAHRLASADVIMHGGEPFSLSLDYLRKICDAIRSNTPNVDVKFHAQTNGTLFNELTLRFCLEWNMTIGLSLDGPRRVNDRHRLDFTGHSSFDAVERTLRLLTSLEGRKVWGGFLAVIDIKTDPLEVYSYLKSFNPTTIDFLFPLHHYEMLPAGKERSIENTPYADWLLPIFYSWYHERPQTTKIRRFRDIIALMVGSEKATEEWGLQPVDFIVVETDGEIQAVDTLKVTYEGANRLGMTIFENSFDEVLSSPLVVERQQRWLSLCSTCQNCNLVKVCGGGYFPHRYSKANGFQNPSVYCADLMKLIRSIYKAVSTDLERVKIKKSS
jgi:uncharacterized protein